MKKVNRYTAMLKRIREALRSAKEAAKLETAVLEHIRPLLDKLPESIEEPCIYRWAKYIDFNGLKHEQTIEVIKAVGGSFKKEYSESTINYISETPVIDDEKLGRWFVRIYAGSPPPNCKLVECGEEFVPGYTRKKWKLQCTEQPANDSQPSGTPSEASPTTETAGEQTVTA